ncbi:PH domain-containing protein [Pseudonocardia sediminis]|uniref:PH domain-containing protein n=1 Tax=Pseudonocardia sediminis TaxID=1397368 RepID=UPI0010290826|nr:PH domain-containing protein [Pseudonocardia sediminis]
MAYPDDLLVEGERVALYSHPHWRICVGPAAVFLLAVAVASFAGAVVRLQTWAPFGWLALAVLAAAAVARWTVVPLVRWRSTHLVVTNHRLLVREGVFSRSGIDVPIHRVDSVRTRRTLGERLAGCGTLLVDAGGEEPMRFADVPDVERVQALLHREISRDLERRREAAVEHAPVERSAS